MSFPARRFALAISAAAAVLISAATTHATALASAASADEGLKCHVIPLHDPSPAEKAYLSGNASQAEMLYREALAKSPHDAALIAALVRTLLREQKVTDADSTITAELPSAPNSAPLLTAFAEVEYREGKLGEAATTADQAYHIDPCNPRLYLVRARIYRLNSMYASERRAIATAHALDPSDIDIRMIWLGRFRWRSASTDKENFWLRLTPSTLKSERALRKV